MKDGNDIFDKINLITTFVESKNDFHNLINATIVYCFHSSRTMLIPD
jgi:hypothetical protein